MNFIFETKVLNCDWIRINNLLVLIDIRINYIFFSRHFQFGWTGTPDLANGIAMERLTIPSLLVVNCSTMYHHLPDDPPHQLTPAAIEMFLDAIISETAVVSIFVLKPYH